MISQINLIKEDEKYIRTLINNLDCSSYDLKEAIEDLDDLDDNYGDNPWSELFDALETLQDKITEVQEYKKWI